jgi:hypothetical protein
VKREYGRYRVIGLRAYRGHQPGDVFEAVIDPAAEQRAIQRRNIELLERVIPTIDAALITFPEGWPPGGHTPNPPREAAKAASLI